MTTSARRLACSFRPHLLGALVGAAACLTISCSNTEPKGQVIATVNGVEITVAELNEEARARGLAIANNRPLRDSLIKDLVDRKLLVQKAVEQKLDRSPQHLLATRRMGEVMLAQQLVAGSSDAPDSSVEQQAANLIRANPAAFEDRALISVDQITIAPVRDPTLSRAVASARTLESLERLLAQAGVKWRRGAEVWDSATLAPQTAKQLLSSAPEKLFLLPMADRLVAGQVVSIKPQPVAEADRMQIARDMVMRQRSDAAFQTLLKNARDGARINYQPGFEAGASSGE